MKFFLLYLIALIASVSAIPIFTKKDGSLGFFPKAAIGMASWYAANKAHERATGRKIGWFKGAAAGITGAWGANTLSRTLANKGQPAQGRT